VSPSGCWHPLDRLPGTAAENGCRRTTTMQRLLLRMNLGPDLGKHRR